jgi:hypothetical protein
LLFLAVGLLSLNASAKEKFLYSFGGAGDAPGEKNIFMNHFLAVDRFGQQNGWHRETLFDGNQPADKAAVATLIGNPNLQSFTRHHLKAELEQIQEDLKSGKIKAGDQVMIMFNTHGAPADGKSSHAVVCADQDCDMAVLKPVLKELEQKGVQTALLDFSCYSGPSINLASTKTCVITGTSDDVASEEFSAELLQNMKPGTSLEEAFLRTRRLPQIFGNPRISSPAGLAAEEVIKSLSPDSPLETDISTFQTPRSRCSCSVNELAKTSQSAKDIAIKSSSLSPSAQQYLNDSQTYNQLYQQAQSLAVEIQSLTEKRPKRGMALYRELQEKKAQFLKLTQSDISFVPYTSALVTGAPLRAAALKTQQSGHKLYDELYQSFKESKENPCAKFVF